MQNHTTCKEPSIHIFSLFQLIHLILENKIQYMSGAAQKYVFNIMEEMVNEGNLPNLLPNYIYTENSHIHWTKFLIGHLCFIQLFNIKVEQFQKQYTYL